MDSICLPVLRSLQPVSLELKKFSNKYPELFFKVRFVAREHNLNDCSDFGCFAGPAERWD